MEIKKLAAAIEKYMIAREMHREARAKLEACRKEEPRKPTHVYYWDAWTVYERALSQWKARVNEAGHAAGGLQAAEDQAAYEMQQLMPVGVWFHYNSMALAWFTYYEKLAMGAKRHTIVTDWRDDLPSVAEWREMHGNKGDDDAC